MLSFFKTKPKLQELIPDNHVDIHSHLLPGIDDGATTIEDTFRLTRALQGFGINQVITTPHVIQNVWNNSALQIKENEQSTILELEKHQISIPFRAAAEYMLDENFVNLFQSEKLLTLKDNFVLVVKYYKTGIEGSFQRRLPLTFTQNKSEEEVAAAVKFYYAAFQH